MAGRQGERSDGNPGHEFKTAPRPGRCARAGRPSAMPTTAEVLRPLLTAAVTTVSAFGLLSAPANASRGVYQCNGSLEIPQSAAELATASSAIACLVNIERAAHGIDPLRRDADLARAARGHALDMVQKQYFAHVGPDGDGLSDRLRAAGYGDPGDGWYA